MAMLVRNGGYFAMPITAWFDAQLDTLFLNSFGTREFLSVADWPRLIAAPDHDDCGSALTRGDFACGKSDESASLRLLLRDPLALLPCFRQADGDRLLTAFDLAAFPARPAFGFSPLVTVHLGFDVAPGALGIFAFGGLWHGSPQSGVNISRCRKLNSSDLTQRRCQVYLVSPNSSH